MSPRRVPDSGALPATAYILKGVDGVALRIAWSELEPAPGRFNWGDLDGEVRLAVVARKRISVGILTGAFTPAWVYDQGAHSGYFIIGPHGGRGGVCRNLRLPVPWSGAYVAAYGELMRALAEHLRNNPGFYESTTIIKLTPISIYTLETRMPAGAGHGAVDGGCGESNAVETWLALGYRPAKVLAAWRSMIRAVDQSFPDKVIAMPILETSGFPPIDDSGVAGTKARPAAAALKHNLIETALSQFKGRLALQWNGLQGPLKISDTVLRAGREGAIIGWQTNQHLGPEGSACRQGPDDKAPCSAASYKAILDFGLANGARYLEVWYPNAVRFPEAVEHASQALRARP